MKLLDKNSTVGDNILNVVLKCKFIKKRMWWTVRAWNTLGNFFVIHCEALNGKLVTRKAVTIKTNLVNPAKFLSCHTLVCFWKSHLRNHNMKGIRINYYTTIHKSIKHCMCRVKNISKSVTFLRISRSKIYYNILQLQLLVKIWEEHAWRD